MASDWPRTFFTAKLFLFSIHVTYQTSPTAFEFLYDTLLILLMGVALVMKHVVSYCQKEQGNAVLAIYFTVKAI